MKPTKTYTPGVGWHEPGEAPSTTFSYALVGPLHHEHCICGRCHNQHCVCSECRCPLPSTHIRGGGYIEVECYCAEHALAAANLFGDTGALGALDPNDMCLDTPLGQQRLRRRCQWRLRAPASQPPRTAS